MYHPAVREVEVLCYTIVSELEQFLEHSAYKDSETEYLLKESKELEHPPHETHILRIALVGDAGQGKSSLLNSMLGYANLAIHVS
jgi:predicted GTPase